MWKHLTNRPLTTDVRVSLIADIIFDHSEIEAPKDLNGSGAQFLIDVMNEVPLHSRVGMIGPSDHIG